MPYRYNEFYLGNTEDDLLVMTGKWGKITSEVRSFMDNLDLEGYLKNVEGVSVAKYDDVSGYHLPDGWKFDMVDSIVENIYIDDIEKYIGEIGIRECCKIIKDSDIFGDELPDLSTDLGLKQVLYCILYHAIQTNSYYEEVSEETLDKALEEADDKDRLECDKNK